MPVSQLFVCYYNLKQEQNLILTIADTVYGFNVQMIRSIDLSMSLERFVATVYSRTYENSSRFWYLGPLFLFISTIYSLAVGAVINYYELPFYYKYICAFTVDVCNICVIQYLKKLNKKQRLFSNFKDVPLSKKYQLVENIRVLSLLMPQSLITFVFAIATNSMVIIRYGLNRPSLSKALVYMWFNLYIIVLTVYWGSKSPLMEHLIAKLLKHNKIDPEMIFDTFGVKIKTKQTVDEHILNLKKAWG
uniref:Gustatory receptor n=1 Tax=Panagrolaimus sp. JU765 TaxID=591449 RepID=A0AC34RKV9_9BILA